VSREKTYYYIANVWDRDELNINHACEFVSCRDILLPTGLYDKFETKWLVDEMAEDYYHNHDGWELAESWAGNDIVFAIWDHDTNFVGKYNVSLEFEPSFFAWKDFV